VACGLGGEGEWANELKGGFEYSLRSSKDKGGATKRSQCAGGEKEDQCLLSYYRTPLGGGLFTVSLALWGGDVLCRKRREGISERRGPNVKTFKTERGSPGGEKKKESRSISPERWGGKDRERESREGLVRDYLSPNTRGHRGPRC